MLFVCGKARMRSPTAADIVAKWPGYCTDFAGLSRDADERLSSDHIEWADVIFVMDRRQKKRLSNQFDDILRDTKVVVLGVPDRFDYMSPELVAFMMPKLKQVLVAPA
ncbi:phosphotyrosine protein phosphatase [Ruegeria denitrificans]|uniref:phosphotyrosine protein phosphatase n=1 Tax=Ruegeria denitrificans TaxID=1715692 RepID=UPI001FB4F696|nr:phosphotyrosine protein phosphatase [Ruegeria denitrificans]